MRPTSSDNKVIILYNVCFLHQSFYSLPARRIECHAHCRPTHIQLWQPCQILLTKDLRVEAVTDKLHCHAYEACAKGNRVTPLYRDCWRRRSLQVEKNIFFSTLHLFEMRFIYSFSLINILEYVRWRVCVCVLGDGNPEPIETYADPHLLSAWYKICIKYKIFLSMTMNYGCTFLWKKFFLLSCY